ncbi:MAG: DUF4340 domain-containing protein [Anaerolineae bacterium]
MKRHQQILAALLVIQIALAVFVFWPDSATGGEAEPIFPDLETEDIVYLSIADDQGYRIVLSKEGGEWVLPEAGNYPAQATAIEPVLEAIAGLDTGTLVARTPASHDRLKVAEDNFVRRIIFEREDGSGKILYLGTSPRYAATHARVDGQDETYLTDGLSTWEVTAQANTWIDAAYFSVGRDALVEVTVENANGTFTFVQEDAGEENAAPQWTMEGLGADETLATSAVNNLIARATSMNMLRPLGRTEEPGYGMDNPTAVVTLTTADGTYTLTVGGQSEADDSYTVKASTSDYYVAVSDFNVRPFVENAREDFLEQEPTPTP